VFFFCTSADPCTVVFSSFEDPEHHDQFSKVLSAEIIGVDNWDEGVEMPKMLKLPISYVAYYNKLVNRRNNDDTIPLHTKLVPLLYEEWYQYMRLDSNSQIDMAIANFTKEFFDDLAKEIVIDYFCFQENGEGDMDFFLRMSGYTFIVNLVLLWVQAIYKFLKLGSAINL